MAEEYKKEIIFSIHASAKEATPSVLACFLQQIFNPRLREGGDTIIVV